MEVYKVDSLPLKDVVMSLASSMNTNFSKKCEEYWVDIPTELGSGEIRGINFDNGLGIIFYNCRFKEDLRIEFTVSDIHPVKYIYSILGRIKHSFANEDVVHTIEKSRSAIVASKRKNGHILKFNKDTDIKIVSLEIDRNKFIENTVCEIDSLIPELKSLFLDKSAEETFYHDGYYDLTFKKIFEDIKDYENRTLARRFHLESTALKIFVNQIIQFEDDLVNEESRSILRVVELESAENLVEYIRVNLNANLTIPDLSERAGLNPNKLQKVFKYLYGKTVNDYITEIRLTSAVELFKKTNLNVSEVASRVGYHNKSYFTKLFKQKYGVTPSVFK